MIIQDIGNDTLYIRYRDGEDLVVKEVKVKPYYWSYDISKNEETKINSEGKKVYKHEYNNSRKRNYIKNKGITFEADVSLENRYLIDNYDKLPEYKPRIMHLDIETAMSLDTVKVPEPITAITVYDNYLDEYVTFSWKKDYPHNLIKKGNWRICVTQTEKEMMQSFINLVTKFDPDIITGWNVINFDIPYIVNRMYHLGIDPNVLSPVGVVEL